MGQAIPAASRIAALQVGVGVTIVNPDYGPKDIQGITLYADYDLLKFIGIEADIHRVSIITPTDLGEDSYLLGPRFYFRKYRFKPYAKAMAGIGRLNFQTPYYSPASSSTFGIYALGGGVDIAVTRRINIRAIDFEVQKWPGYGKGLTPTAITFGVAYRF